MELWCQMLIQLYFIPWLINAFVNFQINDNLATTLIKWTQNIKVSLNQILNCLNCIKVLVEKLIQMINKYKGY